MNLGYVDWKTFFLGMLTLFLIEVLVVVVVAYRREDAQRD